jgi:hypothetical protein
MAIRRELDYDFFKTWSNDMAYVLGFFAADGSMIRNRQGGHYVEFTITDRILLEMIQKVTGSTHKIQERKRRGVAWKAQYRIQIGSKEWFDDLSSLGFMQNKSKRLPFPEIPEEYFGSFVRGYFDGDGCVYFKRLQYADRRNTRPVLMTLFTSGCRPFLVSLWDALKMHGVYGGSLKKKTHGFELVFSHRDSLALHRIMYHTVVVSNMFLPRKRDKLEQAIKVLGLDK